MKLQIKTLARKQLVIDIEDTKTVYDLKRELSLYSDVGVQPELQKLIYNGKVLNNEDQLSVCDIDVKKFMVVMVLKQPEVVATPPTPKADELSTAATNDNSSNASATPKSATTATTDTVIKSTTGCVADPERVAQIIGMGYSEEEARRALVGSNNVMEVAIEFLIEGMPSTLPAPAGGMANDDEWTDIDDDDEDDDAMRILRRDPLFNALRDSVLRDPSLIDAVVEQICGENASLVTLINENRDEFLNALLADITDSDDDESDDDNE